MCGYSTVWLEYQYPPSSYAVIGKKKPLGLSESPNSEKACGCALKVFIAFSIKLINAKWLFSLVGVALSFVAMLMFALL